MNQWPLFFADFILNSHVSATFLRRGFSKEPLNCLVTFSIAKIFSTAINTCNGFLWFPSRGRHSCRIGSWFFLKGLPCTQWCRSHLDRHLCIAHTTGPAIARSLSCQCRPYSPDSGGFEKRPKYCMRFSPFVLYLSSAICTHKLAKADIFQWKQFRWHDN